MNPPLAYKATPIAEPASAPATRRTPPNDHMKKLSSILASIALPLGGIAVLLGLWATLSATVAPDLPSPVKTWQESKLYIVEPFANRGELDRGILAFTSGANAGRAMEIKSHTHRGGLIEIELWQPMGEPIAVGDAFTATAGCDKRLETCVARFANAINYRGFPHMPGNDFIAAVAQPGSTPRLAGSAAEIGG